MFGADAPTFYAVKEAPLSSWFCLSKATAFPVRTAVDKKTGRERGALLRVISVDRCAEDQVVPLS